MPLSKEERTVTQEKLAQRRARMKKFYETHDFDELPDDERAKLLTDQADRESEDYGEDDQTVDQLNPKRDK